MNSLADGLMSAFSAAHLGEWQEEKAPHSCSTAAILSFYSATHSWGIMWSQWTQVTTRDNCARGTFLAAPLSLDRWSQAWRSPFSLCRGSVLFCQWLLLPVSWPERVLNEQSSFCRAFISCDWASGISINYQFYHVINLCDDLSSTCCFFLLFYLNFTSREVLIAKGIH